MDNKRKNKALVKVNRQKSNQWDEIKADPEKILPKTWGEIKGLKESMKNVEVSMKNVEASVKRIEELLKKLLEK